MKDNGVHHLFIIFNFHEDNELSLFLKWDNQHFLYFMLIHILVNILMWSAGFPSGDLVGRFDQELLLQLTLLNFKQTDMFLKLFWNSSLLLLLFLQRSKVTKMILISQPHFAHKTIKVFVGNLSLEYFQFLAIFKQVLKY